MSSIPSAHGVDHVGFTVPHLGDAVAFFCDGLGAELRYELDPVSDPCGPWMRRQLGVHEAAVARIAMLRLGPVTNVELFEYQIPGEPAPRLRGGDWGSHHLGFAVADIDAAVSYLEGLDGVRLLGEPACLPDRAERFVRCETPTGLLLQVREVLARQSSEGTGWPPDRGIPTTRRIEHLGLTVPDLPTAERFFREHLGAEVVSRLEPVWLDAHLMARLGVPAAGVLARSVLRLGPGGAGSLSPGSRGDVELAQFVVPGQRQLPPRNSDHSGHHLALAVEDVDETSASLGSLPEIDPLGTPQTEQAGPLAGTRWQYFRTSWGLHVKVLNPPDTPPDSPVTATRSAHDTAVLG